MLTFLLVTRLQDTTNVLCQLFLFNTSRKFILYISLQPNWIIANSIMHLSYFIVDVPRCRYRGTFLSFYGTSTSIPSFQSQCPRIQPNFKLTLGSLWKRTCKTPFTLHSYTFHNLRLRLRLLIILSSSITKHILLVYR